MITPMDDFFVNFISWAWEWKYPLGLIMAGGFAFQLVNIPKQDRLFSFYMFTSFFLIVTTYWILKPIKKTLFISYHKLHALTFLGQTIDPAQAELLAKELNIVVAFIAMIVYTLLSRRFQREQYTLFISSFFAICLGLFYFFLDSRSIYSVWAFYLYGDLFITSMLLVFFTFLNDSFDPKTSKLTYGMIGTGGALGGFFGSSVIANQSIVEAHSHSVLLSLGLVLLIMLIEHFAAHLIERKPALEFHSTTTTPLPEGGMYANSMEGMRLTLRSPYLMWLAGIVMFYEITSIVVDFQFTSSVIQWVNPVNYKIYFASVYAFTNFTSLLVQIFLTNWVIKRFGLAVALCVLPISILFGSIGYLVFPILLFGSLLNTFDYAFAYSLQQTAKELLYVPISRQEKYEAKAFIDNFWLRLGKGIAVLVVYFFSLEFAGNAGRWFSALLIIVMFAWIILGILAGRYHKKLEDEQA
jgi:AAA family ATP:ADP antiporter